MTLVIHIPIWLLWGIGGIALVIIGVFVGFWVVGKATEKAVGRGLGW
jgi:hypothetical protein